jgi:hypothetical protein
MKIKHFIIIIIWILSIFPIVISAQQTSSSSNLNYKSNGWKPVKISQADKNVMNGVEFFHKRGICKSDTAAFIKVVNLNKFPVKIQWQDGSGATISILIPASSEAEGNCDSDNAESIERKLVIVMSKFKLEKVDSSKNGLISTLKVTEVKD